MTTLEPVESADSSAKPTALHASHAGVANMGLKLGGTAMAFALNLLLARSMSPESFAQVSVALAWVALATALGSSSTPLVLMRFVGENLAVDRPDLARGVIRYAIVVATVSSLLLVAVAATSLGLGWTGIAPQALPVAALCVAMIPPNALLTVVTGLLQALKRALAAELLGSGLRSLLLLLALCALWSGTGRGALSPSTVMELYLCVSLLLLLLAGWIAIRAQRAAIRPVRPAYDLEHWTRAGLTLMAVILAAAASERIDLLMLGWRAPGSEVANYAVAQRFSQILLFTVNAVGTVMAPHFVALLPSLRSGETAAAQSLVRSSAGLTLLTCLLAWLGFALAGPWLTSLFGPHYSAAYAPLLILMTGQLAAALFGPGTLIATLSGRARFAFLNLLLAMAVNVFLNALMVPWLGAVGAAIATATSGTVSAAVAHAWLRRALGIRIGAFPYRDGRGTGSTSQ